MPLSVDMRNLRSIYIYFCTTFKKWLGFCVVAGFYLLRKCVVSADVAQEKQTREHVLTLFIQIHDGTNNMFHVILDQTPQHAL